MLRTSLRRVFTRSNSSLGTRRIPQVESDNLGIPTRPTWSVDELLSSYPKPLISPDTLGRLHELSALIPPEKGTHAHAKLLYEMENLIKLVEAVKLIKVDTSNELDTIPDGRIWAEGAGIELFNTTPEAVDEAASGRDLLRYAERISPNGMYLVEADRTK